MKAIVRKYTKGSSARNNGNNNNNNNNNNIDNPQLPLLNRRAKRDSDLTDVSEENVPAQNYDSTTEGRRGRVRSSPATLDTSSTEGSVFFTPPRGRKEPEWRKVARERSHQLSFLDEDDYTFQQYRMWRDPVETWKSSVFQAIVLLCAAVLLPSPVYIFLESVIYYCIEKRQKLRIRTKYSKQVILMTLLSIFKDCVITAGVWCQVLAVKASVVFVVFTSTVLVVAVTIVYFPAACYHFAAVTYGFFTPGSTRTRQCVNKKYKRHLKATKSDKDNEPGDEALLTQFITVTSSDDEINLFLKGTLVIYIGIVGVCVVSIATGVLTALYTHSYDKPKVLVGGNRSNSRIVNKTVLDNNATVNNTLESLATLTIGYRVFDGVVFAVSVALMLNLSLFLIRWRLLILKSWFILNNGKSNQGSSLASKGITGVINWFQTVSILQFFAWSSSSLTGICRVGLNCALVAGMVVISLTAAVSDAMTSLTAALIGLNGLLFLQLLFLFGIDFALIYQERKARHKMRYQMLNISLELARILEENEVDDYEYQAYIKRSRAKNLRTLFQLAQDVIAYLDENRFGWGASLVGLWVILCAFFFASAIAAAILRR